MPSIYYAEWAGLTKVPRRGDGNVKNQRILRGGHDTPGLLNPLQARCA